MLGRTLDVQICNFPVSKVLLNFKLYDTLKLLLAYISYKNTAHVRFNE